MKKGWFALGLVLVLLVIIAAYQANRITRYLFFMVFERFQSTENTYSIDFEQIGYRWPLSLVVKNLDIQGDHLVVAIPSLVIRWSPADLTAQRNTPSIRVEELLIESHSHDFWESLPVLGFQDLPDFSLFVDSVTVQGPTIPMFSFSIDVRKITDRVIFSMVSDLFSAQGTLREKESLRMVFTGGAELARTDVRAEWDFAGGIVSASLQQAESVTVLLTASPAISTGFLILQGLNVEVAGVEGFNFSGEARLELGGDFQGALEGSWRYRLSSGSLLSTFLMSRDLEVLEGAVSLSSLDQDVSMESVFSLSLETGIFKGILLEGTYFMGVPLPVDISGHISPAGLELFFRAEPFDCSVLPVAGLAGSGIVEGHITYSAQAGFSVNGEFISQFLQFNELKIDDPRLGFWFDEAEGFNVNGSGGFLGGSISVSGGFEEAGYRLTGHFEQVSPELFWEDSLPIRGALSGELTVFPDDQSGEVEILLTLTDGEIFWHDEDVGRITGGNIQLANGGMEATGIVINKEGGFLEGSFSRPSTSGLLSGTLWIGDYPVISRMGNHEISAVLKGTAEIVHGMNLQEVDLDLEISSWQIGPLIGEQATLRVRLDGDTIMVDHCTVELPQGTLTLAGTCMPYHYIDFFGALNSLSVPEETFGFEAELVDVKMAVEGPWDAVLFTFSGRGCDFMIGEAPFGDSFEIELAGSGILPGPGEAFDWEDYLDPSYLDKGVLRIHGVRLDQLGFSFIQDYGLGGSTDLVGDLLFEENCWEFTTQNLQIDTPWGLSVSGELVGSYDGERMVLRHIALADQDNGLYVTGEGVFDPTGENILKFQISADTHYACSDPAVDIHLIGHSDIMITGIPDEVEIEGEVVIEQLEIVSGTGEALELGGVRGHLRDRQLLIVDGTGYLAGLSFQPRGVIDQEGVHLVFTLDEDSRVPPLEGMIEGTWQGRLILSGAWHDLQARGDLFVYGGMIDTTQQVESAISGYSLEGVQHNFRNIPIPMKLSVSVGDTLRVKTRFLELELDGGLEIDLHGEAIDITGRLELVEGHYNLIMHSFPLQGYVVFGNLFGVIPQLDFEGRKRIDRYWVTLRAVGPLDDYRLTLESEPMLSQEELVSLLILGSAQAHESLDRINVTGPLLKVIHFLLGEQENALSRGRFFDSISLVTPGVDGDGFYGISLKKELGENLFISYTQDLSGTSRSLIGLEFEFDHEWSFRADFEQEGSVEWMLEFNTRF